MFQHADLKITRTTTPGTPPPHNNLVFGETFSDHMFSVNWDVDKGWGTPVVKPFENLSLHPGTCALHYGIEVRLTALTALTSALFCNV